MDGHGGCSLLFSSNCKSVCGGTKRKFSIWSFMYSLRKEFPLLFSLHPNSDSSACRRAHAYMLKSLRWLSHGSLQNFDRYVAIILQTLCIYPNCRWIVFNLAMHGLPTADLTRSENRRITERLLHSLKYYVLYACATAVAAVAGQLDEYNNKGTEGSLGSSQTQTQALFSFKLIYTFMQSCHVLCFLHALHHFVALLVCPGRVSFHHYTCMHRSNWDSLIKQHSEYIQCGASVLRCPRTVLVLG